MNERTKRLAQAKKAIFSIGLLSIIALFGSALYYMFFVVIPTIYNFVANVTNAVVTSVHNGYEAMNNFFIVHPNSIGLFILATTLTPCAIMSVSKHVFHAKWPDKVMKWFM